MYVARVPSDYSQSKQIHYFPHWMWMCRWNGTPDCRGMCHHPFVSESVLIDLARAFVDWTGRTWRAIFLFSPSLVIPEPLIHFFSAVKYCEHMKSGDEHNSFCLWVTNRSITLAGFPPGPTTTIGPLMWRYRASLRTEEIDPIVATPQTVQLRWCSSDSSQCALFIACLIENQLLLRFTPLAFASLELDAAW